MLKNHNKITNILLFLNILSFLTLPKDTGHLGSIYADADVGLEEALTGTPENIIKFFIRAASFAFGAFVCFSNYGTIKKKLNGPVTWLFVYLTWALFSILWSSISLFSFLRWIELSGGFLLVLSLSIHNNDIYDFKNTVDILLKGCLVAVSFVIIMAIIDPVSSFAHNPSGVARIAGYAHAGYVGWISAIAAIIVFIRLLYGRRSFLSIAFKMFALTIAIIGLALAYSRGPMIILALLVLNLSYNFINIKKNFLRVSLIPLTLFIATVVMISFSSALWDWFLRGDDMTNIVTFSSRIWIWSYYLQNIFTGLSLIWGHGYLSTGSENMDIFFEAPDGHTAVATTPHNAILTIMSGMGSIGVLLMVAVISITVRRMLKKRATSAFGNPKSVHLEIAYLFYFSLFIGIVEYSFGGQSTPLMIVFFLAVIASSYRKQSFNEKLVNQKRLGPQCAY